MLVIICIVGGRYCSSSTKQRITCRKVKKIGDKLIRETPFAYKLGLASCSTSFNTLNFVDFGRTFGVGQEAVAYAYTQLSFPRDTTIRVETEHNDACKIWCNGQLVYENKGKRDIKINRGNEV